MTERQQRRLAAIFAADIAGYSALRGADEARTVRDLKAHQAVILADHGGRIIDTAGDGILAEFGRPAACAPMFTATPRTSLPRSPSMTCDFVTVDVDGQAQPIQIKFSILADPPVFGTRNHNWRNRSQALNNLLRFGEASQMGQA